jgi:hypothetical protein
VWGVFPELTPVLSALKTSPDDMTEESMAVMERFVVLLYDRTSSLTKVNEARQQFISKRSRELDNIPPTRAALDQHVRRAVLEGRHVWGQTIEIIVQYFYGSDPSTPASASKSIHLEMAVSRSTLGVHRIVIFTYPAGYRICRISEKNPAGYWIFYQFEYLTYNIYL